MWNETEHSQLEWLGRVITTERDEAITLATTFMYGPR
jgi:hypothetical protein